MPLACFGVVAIAGGLHEVFDEGVIDKGERGDVALLLCWCAGQMQCAKGTDENDHARVFFTVVFVVVALFLLPSCPVSAMFFWVDI